MSAFGVNDSYRAIFDALSGERSLAAWLPVLRQAVEKRFNPEFNGNLHAWLKAYGELPDDLSGEFVSGPMGPVIGSSRDFRGDPDELVGPLMKLHPWRKGPFELFGIHIDAEWRSDMKWDRLKPHVKGLQGQAVLDIGCGNGYYLMRMLEYKPRILVGIDPSVLYAMQFKALSKYISVLPDMPPMDIFPVAAEELPVDTEAFDTVFYMGVLYHRRDPVAHLELVKSFLRPRGRLLLETLAVESDGDCELVPGNGGRYAGMRNVWHVPSVKRVGSYLRDAGFCEIRNVSLELTTTSEQRLTRWMTFHSLDKFLDAANPSLTVEGYPAPRRLLVIARK